MKNSARLLNRRAIRTPLFTTSAYVGAALFILALLLATKSLPENLIDGFIFVTSGERWPDAPTATATDSVHRTILVLRGLAVAVPAFGLILGWLPQWWAGYRCRNIDHNHTVICGLGWQGRAYAYANKNHPNNTAAIEISDSPEVTTFCDELNVYFIHGAADQPSTLQRAGVARAKQLFICTGNQDLNLQVAGAVKEAVAQRSAALDPLKVYVSMGASLADSASTDEMFSELLGSCKQAHFSFYDPEQRMARIFYYQYPVYKWAQEQFRPANKAVRVHLVFLGFNRLAGELILQYSRIWPCLEHEAPRFTVVVPEESRAQRFITRHGAIYQQPPDGLETLADVEIKIAHANEIQLLDAERIDNISKAGTVTAVICCDDNAEHNLQRASHCRQITRKLDCWHVPILVHVDKREGTDELLELSQRQIDSGDRILPFGSATDYCDLKLIDYMDRWACAIHKGYQPTAAEIDATLPANRPWAELSHFDHASNHRATDHIPLKLYTAGYQWSDSKPWPLYLPDQEQIKKLYTAKFEELELLLTQDSTNDLPIDDNAIKPFSKEKIAGLSSLEHRSWLYEHRIEGFTRGVHDKTVRRTHPDIVNWNSLSGPDQVKDLKQIVTIAHRLATKRKQPNAALPTRLVLTGSSLLTMAQAKACQSTLEKLLTAEFFKEHFQQRWLEIISPLAPGADCLLTQTILQHVTGHYTSDGSKYWQYEIPGVSLIQPGTVPLRQIDDLQKAAFTHLRNDAANSDAYLWQDKNPEQSFEHYKTNNTELRRQILRDVNMHNRVHLYADGLTPVVWTEKHQQQLNKIDNITKATSTATDAVDNLATAIKIAADWMHERADIIILIEPQNTTSNAWSTHKKPLYRIDCDSGELESINI